MFDFLKRHRKTGANTPEPRNFVPMPPIEPPKDAVNHPSHYNTGKIEVIDAIEDWKLNFSRGNAVKYIARAGHKGDELEDLRKAAWYINREVKRLEKMRRNAIISAMSEDKSGV